MTNVNTCIKTPAGTIVTPKGRSSFFQDAFRPNSTKKTKDGKQKWSISILIPPTSDIEMLKTAAEAAGKEGFPNLPPHKKLKSPFLDAYEKTGDEQFKGWILLRLSTTTKPAIVDARGQHVPDAELDRECYSGRWIRASVKAFHYDTDGNLGVSFALSNVQVLDHDEPLGGGRTNPENEFVPVEVAAGDSADDMFS